jgi:DNA-binding MurR/RpiR family transcriptional regulator
MTVAETVRAHGGRLTPTERRIATVVLDSPQIVGFGTVADLADEADAGAATVVRFANKLGYDGFVGLQRAVRRDLSGQLRPAAERIREQRQGLDHVRDHAAIEQANVAITLTDVDTAATRVVVNRLADERSDVLVLSGAASRGVALQFVIELSQLRTGVSMLDGNPVDVARELALAGAPPTIVAIDIRRYDRWVVDTLRLASERGAWVVAVTDSVLSPLASVADHAYLVAADSPGPFDSHVGTLALLDVLVVGVAGADRDRATERLDRQESLWRATDALIDE